MTYKETESSSTAGGDGLKKLQQDMATILNNLSLLASKAYLADISRSVAVATTRVATLEQQIAGGAAASTSTGVPCLRLI
ncbi:hypothetical protein GUJ93_ZPchr0001g29820 [Zizania palustris]|uniref:Uncharacterized protein n=1 Tax=Zizania palustris TaxID=103762 RepID=A0A8J5RML9_ZIZPA|nr:hypothetical protein GUJ93_ZPchr0001g29820 [Zizania palustris]